MLLNINRYHKIIAVLVVLLICSIGISRLLYVSWKKKQDVLTGEIVRNQEVIKEKDGVYLRMVNRYDQSKDSLRNKVKEIDSQLAKALRKNKEDILMYEDIILSFKPKTDTVFLTDTVLGDYEKAFTFFYPQKTDWFVKLGGGIRSDSVFGSWQFQNLPISLILTENKDGSWNRRVIGPEWLKVSKIDVNSILKPPSEIKRDLYFPVGIGYTFFTDTRMMTLSGGVSWKRLMFLASTSYESQIGIGFGVNGYFRF